MADIHHLLAASQSTAPVKRPVPSRVLVLGGGGPLGSAVLEALLGRQNHAAVAVAVTRPINPTLRGLAAVPDDDAAWRDFAPSAAVIVLDRQRRSNGRDDAFLTPQPAHLVTLAQRARMAGAGALVVAVPHTAALMPQALMRGLATLDEGAVARLDFSHLVFMRMAQAGDAGESDAAKGNVLDGLAAWVLRQLRWMVPATEQPVRNSTVADVVAELVTAIPAAVPGTRVMPPAILWNAAQGANLPALLHAWLTGGPLPLLRR